MKILYVTPSYYPIIGGTEVAVDTLTKKLNQYNIKTDILTYNMDKKWEPYADEKIEIKDAYKILKEPGINIKKYFPLNIFKIFNMNIMPLFSIIKKFEKYDIIHFHGEADLSLPIISLLYHKKPKIFHSHSNNIRHILQERNVIKRILLMKGFKYIFPRIADYYIGVDEEYFLNCGIKKSKIIVLPFCVDTELFNQNTYNKENNLLLYVGRIEKNKGLLILLKALSYLNVKIHLIIIGPRWDEKYFNKCMLLIEEINKKGKHKVEYLGEMRNEDLVTWYQQSTILIRPDLLGISGGLSTLEALACGTPVIGTGNHVIKDEINGLIITPHNIKELALAIEKLLSNKDLRQIYGENGKKLIEEKYSYNNLINRLGVLYDNIIYG